MATSDSSKPESAAAPRPASDGSDLWGRSEGGGPTPLQQRLLTLSTAMMASMSLVWGSIYFIFGEKLAAFIPWTYMGVSFLSLAVLTAPRYYGLLRASQLLFSLVLPFLLMWSLGGFVNSSAVVLWSFTCPMGALVFAGRRQALYWFIAFLSLVAFGAGLNYPAVQVDNNLPIAAVVSLFVLNLTGVSLVAFVLMRYFVGQTTLAYGLLAREQERSETLLRNMLPESIAARLKEDNKPIADRLEGVSIVFADIVGFTTYAMIRPPEVVVELLDDVFSEFDHLANKHGLEKIKTIGDAYMACGGLDGNAQSAAEATAKFSLEAKNVLNSISEKGNHKIDLRVGIHTGAVVAGVIGESKYSYDIWGDAVNVAARLQQSAEPGEIILSKDTQALLPAAFKTETAGETDLKGHTPVETFRLFG